MSARPVRATPHSGAPLPPALAAWVERSWASARPASAPAWPREHSLPTGSLHLAVRLDGPPLRTYADADDALGRSHPPALLAGARAGYVIKDASRPAASVGAMLRPGAALALFGVSAAELEGGYVGLDELCGAGAADGLYERLAAAADPRSRRRLFEAFLRARLRPVRGLDPQIVRAVRSLQGAAPGGDCAAGADERRVAGWVAASGRSHRRFIAGFRDAAGLSPKRYARVLRFKRLLQALAATPRPDWAQLALDGGYFDQSHLIREFREFAGVSPRAYLAAAAASPHHLPIGGPKPV